MIRSWLFSLALAAAGVAQQTHGGDRHQHHVPKSAEEYAKILEDPKRDAWQKPHEVVMALDLKPTDTVADIGAGSGYSYKKPLPVGPQPEMKIAREALIAEVRAAGFRLAKEHSFLTYPYFLVFQAGGTRTASLVLHNGNILTVNDRQPRAEAVAASGGKIVFVGSTAGAKKYIGPKTQAIDLQGLTVVPGLADSHYHLSGVGAREMSLNLEGTTSLTAFLAAVKTRAGGAKPGEWITGSGWNEGTWKPQVFPTRYDLDKIVPRNPVWLTRTDGHGSVANSAAIRIAGVTADTKDPFGGEIMRDPQTREATGMFLDNAQGLVSRHIPPEPPGTLRRALILGVERSLKLGWTQVGIPGNSYREVDEIRELYQEGRIKLRIYNAVRGPSADTRRLLQEGPTIGAYDGRFNLRGIKVSFDGAIGSKGAALLAPYHDHSTAGFLKWKEEDLLPMFEEALRKGVQMQVHAIGDRANREILNLYEKALERVPPAERQVAEPRWRVEHAQHVSAGDIPRFAELKIIPSMQPSHAISDLLFLKSRLGLERMGDAYAWQSFLKSGSTIAGGSDAPVERGEPMIEFYAAVARKTLDGKSGEGWHPEQAVSREQALKMLTIWPAYAMFEENVRGSIEPGKWADFTVLSRDILKIPVSEIPKTTCKMTIIAGDVVYAGL